MNAEKPIRVLLVDDQTLVRQGIRSLLTLAAQVEVVAEASDGIEALAAIEQTRPDVVLLDLRMPRLDGAGTLKVLAERDFRPPVLVLTTFDDDEAVLDVLRAGARGFLLKDVTLDELVHAIETLARGGRLVQPAVTAALLQRLAGRPAAGDEHPAAQALTTREVEILELMAGGFANREIARAAPCRRHRQEPCVIDPAQARRPRPHPRRPSWPRARSVQRRRPVTGTSAEAVVIEDCGTRQPWSSEWFKNVLGSPASHLSDSAFQQVPDELPAPNCL